MQSRPVLLLALEAAEQKEALVYRKQVELLSHKGDYGIYDLNHNCHCGNAHTIFSPGSSLRTILLTARETQKKISAKTETLEFREFFEPVAGELKPSAKLLSLNGKHVRLVGFMAQMEEPPRGAFYLCPRPVFCDEGGGGTADLPAETVLVLARSAQGQKIAFIPRALEVTGILEVGHQTDENGRVSTIRLVLDRPQALPHSTKSIHQSVKSGKISKS